MVSHMVAVARAKTESQIKCIDVVHVPKMSHTGDSLNHVHTPDGKGRPFRIK